MRPRFSRPSTLLPRACSSHCPSRLRAALLPARARPQPPPVLRNGPPAISPNRGIMPPPRRLWGIGYLPAWAAASYCFIANDPRHVNCGGFPSRGLVSRPRPHSGRFSRPALEFAAGGAFAWRPVRPGACLDSMPDAVASRSGNARERLGGRRRHARRSCSRLVEVDSGGFKTAARNKRLPLLLGLVDLRRNGSDFLLARLSSRRRCQSLWRMGRHVDLESSSPLSFLGGRSLAARGLLRIRRRHGGRRASRLSAVFVRLRCTPLDRCGRLSRRRPHRRKPAVRSRHAGPFGREHCGAQSSRLRNSGLAYLAGLGSLRIASGGAILRRSARPRFSSHPCAFGSLRPWLPSYAHRGWTRRRPLGVDQERRASLQPRCSCRRLVAVPFAWCGVARDRRRTRSPLYRDS